MSVNAPKGLKGGTPHRFARPEGRISRANPPKEYDPLIVDAILAGQRKPDSGTHAEFSAACQLLQTRDGMLPSAIAKRLDVQERRVYRALDTAVEAMPPLDLPDFDHSELRQEQVQDLALQVMGLATELRNGPLAVWDEVKDLEQHQIIELFMVACAMIPIDAPARRLLKWVEDVPMISVPA